MKHREAVEFVAGGCTLALSLYVAFGPLRHRLPKVLTRVAKYSATLKLTSLSVLCWYGLYHNISRDGPMALRWGATVLGVVFLASAYCIVRRPVIHRPRKSSRPIPKPSAPTPAPASASKDGGA